MYILFCFSFLYVIITIIRVDSAQRWVCNGMMCVCVCAWVKEIRKTALSCVIRISVGRDCCYICVFCSLTPMFYHARENIYLTIIESVFCRGSCIFHICVVCRYCVLLCFRYRNVFGCVSVIPYMAMHTYSGKIFVTPIKTKWSESSVSMHKHHLVCTWCSYSSI